VGANSEDIKEPLCFYVPFITPRTDAIESGTFKSISKVHVTVAHELSDVLKVVSSADRLSIEQGDQHLMEVTFDGGKGGKTVDLRPDMPLIVNW
jgi:hypothetical protein